eukprot:TRINITY_DN11461_c0_g2_i1.p1 TRINITY_DN11461_c0_g2~~TRINITY_DN11461_c0_g2_i1.p1  ORF type:complete len:1201 (+),score=212.83 TRINITY_DN11461_c0_g2_i1:324-3605(+)
MKRAALDGSQSGDAFAAAVVKPGHLDVHAGSDLVYWVDSGTIKRATLSGADARVVVASGISTPQGLAVDPRAGGKVYWTDSSWDDIRCANADGSDVRGVGLPLSMPTGIAIDLRNDKLYWADSGVNKIQRSNLDGTGLEDIVTSGVSWPGGILLDVDEGKIYWTNNWAMNIKRANLDGSGNVEDVIASTDGAPWALAGFHPTPTTTGVTTTTSTATTAAATTSTSTTATTTTTMTTTTTLQATTTTSTSTTSATTSSSTSTSTTASTSTTSVTSVTSTSTTTSTTRTTATSTSTTASQTTTSSVTSATSSTTATTATTTTITSSTSVSTASSTSSATTTTTSTTASTTTTTTSSTTSTATTTTTSRRLAMVATTATTTTTTVAVRSTTTTTTTTGTTRTNASRNSTINNSVSSSTTLEHAAGQAFGLSAATSDDALASSTPCGDAQNANSSLLTYRGLFTFSGVVATKPEVERASRPVLAAALGVCAASVRLLAVEQLPRRSERRRLGAASELWRVAYEVDIAPPSSADLVASARDIHLREPRAFELDLVEAFKQRGTSAAAETLTVESFTELTPVASPTAEAQASGTSTEPPPPPLEERAEPRAAFAHWATGGALLAAVNCGFLLACFRYFRRAGSSDKDTAKVIAASADSPVAAVTAVTQLAHAALSAASPSGAGKAVRAAPALAWSSYECAGKRCPQPSLLAPPTQSQWWAAKGSPLSTRSTCAQSVEIEDLEAGPAESSKATAPRGNDVQLVAASISLHEAGGCDRKVAEDRSRCLASASRAPAAAAPHARAAGGVAKATTLRPAPRPLDLEEGLAGEVVSISIGPSPRAAAPAKATAATSSPSRASAEDRGASSGMRPSGAFVEPVQSCLPTVQACVGPRPRTGAWLTQALFGAASSREAPAKRQGSSSLAAERAGSAAASPSLLRWAEDARPRRPARGLAGGSDDGGAKAARASGLVVQSLEQDIDVDDIDLARSSVYSEASKAPAAAACASVATAVEETSREREVETASAVRAASVSETSTAQLRAGAMSRAPAPAALDAAVLDEPSCSLPRARFTPSHEKLQAREVKLSPRSMRQIPGMRRIVIG